MHRVPGEALLAYLLEVDHALDTVVSIVIIGGAAVALGYRIANETADIDLWGLPDPTFWIAVDRCRHHETAVPVSTVGIATPPLNFEDRLIRIPIPGARRLEVFVPEIHDLALLKTARGEAHDFAAIAGVHLQVPLSLETLIERYGESLSQVIGPVGRFRLNFLALIERLFGEKTAEAVEDRLPQG